MLWGPGTSAANGTEIQPFVLKKPCHGPKVLVKGEFWLDSYARFKFTGSSESSWDHGLRCSDTVSCSGPKRWTVW